MEVIIGLATPSSVGYVAGMETPIRPWSVVIAASVSLTVGITFGIYPARQAPGSPPSQPSAVVKIVDRCRKKPYPILHQHLKNSGSPRPRTLASGAGGEG